MIIDKAVQQRTLPERVVGRLVGDQGAHIAIATGEKRNGDALLLAVRHDGEEYVIWYYSPSPTGTGVSTFWGDYFPNQGKEPIVDTFNRAVAKFRAKLET